jgi:hypothetical protein
VTASEGFFPRPRGPETIVETGLMWRTRSRTFAVHKTTAGVVWSGPPRNGKTQTARWLSRTAEALVNSDPDGFRIKHYEVGEIAKGMAASRRGVQSLYNAAIGRLSEQAFRFWPLEELARQLVHGLEAQNIQMIMVDEAGLLPVDAIRGMITVLDTAELMDWPLTLVFIGMDDLATTVEENAQVRHRIHEWCYFEPYSLDETAELLRALHPHFADLNMAKAEDREQVEFIHSRFGGLPGNIVPFLRKFSRLEDKGFPITYAGMMGLYRSTVRDRAGAHRDAAEGVLDLAPYLKRTEEDEEDEGDADAAGAAVREPTGPQPRAGGRAKKRA